VDLYIQGEYKYEDRDNWDKLENLVEVCMNASCVPHCPRGALSCAAPQGLPTPVRCGVKTERAVQNGGVRVGRGGCSSTVQGISNSWFKEFKEDIRYNLSETTYNETNFYTDLKDYLTTTEGRRFESDVKFTEDELRIETSRCDLGRQRLCPKKACLAASVTEEDIVEAWPACGL